MAIDTVKYARIEFTIRKIIHIISSLDGPAEILNCIGNVSEFDGETFVHAHVALGLKDGTTKCGHLVEGTKIFAYELFVVPLHGRGDCSLGDPEELSNFVLQFTVP